MKEKEKREREKERFVEIEKNRMMTNVFSLFVEKLYIAHQSSTDPVFTFAQRTTRVVAHRRIDRAFNPPALPSFDLKEGSLR